MSLVSHAPNPEASSICADSSNPMGIDSAATGASRRNHSNKPYRLLVSAAAVAYFGTLAGASVGWIADDVRKLGEHACGAQCMAGLLQSVAIFAFYALLVVLVSSRIAPKNNAAGLVPRIAAAGGSFLLLSFGLFPRRQDLSAAEQFLSAGLMSVGLGFAVWTLLWLGRSFSIMPEARRLVTGGPYRLVRHPLYIAEFIASVGAVLPVASIWTLPIWVLQIAYQIRRMRYEEEVLTATFPEYRAYAARTARLLPGIW